MLTLIYFVIYVVWILCFDILWLIWYILSIIYTDWFDALIWMKIFFKFVMILYMILNEVWTWKNFKALICVIMYGAWMYIFAKMPNFESLFWVRGRTSYGWVRGRTSYGWYYHQTKIYPTSNSFMNKRIEDRGK